MTSFSFIFFRKPKNGIKNLVGGFSLIRPYYENLKRGWGTSYHIYAPKTTVQMLAAVFRISSPPPPPTIVPKLTLAK